MAHSVLSLLLLIASVLILGLGPFSFYAARRHPAILQLLDLGVVVCIFILVSLFILPDLFNTAGWMILPPFLVGLLLPTFIEYFFHTYANKTHYVVSVLVALGLSIHAILDGISLSLAASAKMGSRELPYLIPLHRIPESLIVWRLFLPNKRNAWISLGALAVGTMVGYFLGLSVSHCLTHYEIPYLEACIAGFLCHIVIHQYQH